MKKSEKRIFDEKKFKLSTFKTDVCTFIYHPAPKCCSTSVKQMIYNAVGIKKDFNEMTEGWPHNELSKPINTIKFKQADADIRLCVLRDPVERFLSGYANRVKYKKIIKNPPEFDQFLENFNFYFENNESVNHHFSPQTYFIGDDPLYYTHVYFDSEIEKVVELINYIFSANIKNIRKQTGGKKPENLSDHQISLIKNFYEDDYLFIEKVRNKR